MATENMPTPDPGVWSTFRDAPLAAKAILIGVFLSRLGGFLNIFIVLFLTARGYSREQAAFALGVYGVGGVAGVLLGGSVADRLGARNATVLSMGATAVLTAALLYLPDYSLLLAAILVVSLAAQLYRPASATLMSELIPEDRQVMIFGMYRFGLNMGAMVAPLLGFGLYNLGDHSYTLLFWGEGLIAMVYAAVAVVAIPGGRKAAATGPGGGAGGPDSGGGYPAMLRDRRYLLFLTAVLLNAIVYVQYLSTLPLDVKAAGISMFWYTLAVSLNGFIVIAFELPLTKFSQRWPFKLTVGLAFTLVGLGVAAYGLPMGAVVIIGATLLWTLGEIIGGPAVFAYPALAGPDSLRSRYIGGFQFMHALGTALGPVIGGLLFVRIGHGVWPLFAVAGLLAALFGVLAIRPEAVTRGNAAPEPELVAGES
ncbi:MFS transporter [Actinomadura xylanilytica]|uniref:MFS transporter n=1 Tax=Actinomadura xylanilytica TaxID=887459 RepID=UPI00255AE399|nr:MFS transporter [Actinomadura xylanilytica]MDL4774184.1 MFS transporter [Actinomadura xylanilytica]